MKKIIKDNIKLIIGFIIGGVVFGTLGVYAATIYYQGNNVGYDNSKTGFKDSNGNNVEDVQTALDELYTKASKTVTLDGLENVGFQTNSAKTVFANSNGVCITRKGKTSCFKTNNWTIEKNHIQQVFSDISCYANSYGVDCNASDFDCFIASDDSVYCSDNYDGTDCNVHSDGSVNCY